jgi:hypothetical protein
MRVVGLQMVFIVPVQSLCEAQRVLQSPDIASQMAPAGFDAQSVFERHGATQRPDIGLHVVPSG